MDYEVQLAPLDKIITTPSGPFRPLCDSCTALDCTNPIQEKTVSFVGQTRKCRIYVISEGVLRQVVACKGYVGDAIPPMGQPGRFS